MKESGQSGSLLLEVRAPEPGALYSLETVVHLTGASRRNILVYCKSGLIQPRPPDAGPMAFDDAAIYSIRAIEYLRSMRGINLEGIRMIFELRAQLRRLEQETRFLRSA